MARSGPTIPIYIDIDTSAREAIAKWDKYNKEFNKINKKYEASAKNAGLKKSEYTAMFDQLAKYRTAMKGTAKSADELRARVAALKASMDAVNPNSKRWGKYAAKLKETQAALAGVEAKTRAAEASAARLTSAFGLQTSYVGRLIERMILYASLHKFAQMIRSVREVTAEFELQKVALGALLQNTTEAAILFERIKAAAIESPFQIKDLVKYTKQLAAYRIEQDELFDTTQRLADLSAGLGVEMDRLILAFGQVKSASVLRGQEMRQFTEAGIPMVQALADKFTELQGRVVSTAEVFDLVSKRAVSFEMVKEVIEDMTSVTGQFYNMQEKQAQTLAGQWSNLKDAVSLMYDEIGRSEGVREGIEWYIRAVKKLAANWQSVMKVFKGAITAMITMKVASIQARIASSALSLAEARLAVIEQGRTLKVSRLTTLLIGEAAATKYNAWVTNLLHKAQIRAAMSSTILGKATASLGASLVKMLTGPIGIGLAAVGLLLAGLMKATSQTEEVIDHMGKAMDAAKELQGKVDAYTKGKEEDSRLSTTYEKLAKKQSRSLAEESQMQNAAKQIVDRYGDAVVDSYDKATGAISINIEKLNELIGLENQRRLDAANDEIVKKEEALAKARAALVEEENKLKHMRANPEHLETMTMQSTAGAFSMSRRVGYSEEDVDKQIKQVQAAKDAVSTYVQALADARNGLTKVKLSSEEVLEGWRKSLLSYKATVDGVNYNAFYTEQISKFESEKDMIDDTAKEYKKYKAQRESLEKAILTAKDKSVKAALEKDKRYATALEKLYGQILTDFNGWDAVKNNGGYKRPAWMDEMTDQMKFMKDFDKGVDSLRKYRSELDAVKAVQDQMRGRALSLGLNVDELDGKDATISDWYQKQIEAVQKKLKGYKGFGKAVSVADMLGIKTTSEAAKDLQKLLQSLWDAKTDLDLKTKENEFKNALDRLARNVAQSKEAKQFWNTIFESTGDKSVATRLTEQVFGRTGADLQKEIQAELAEAFSGISVENFGDDLIGKEGFIAKIFKGEDANKPAQELDAILKKMVQTAIQNEDWVKLRELILAVPETGRKAAEQLVNDGIKTNADWLKDIIKTFSQAKSFADRMQDIRNKAEKDRRDIAKSKMSPEDKATYTAAVTKKELEDIARVQMEAFKNTDEWQMAFENLDRVGSKSLARLKKKIEEFIAANKDTMSPTDLKTMQTELNKITTAYEKLGMNWKELGAIFKDSAQAIGEMRRANSVFEPAKKGDEEKARQYEEKNAALENAQQDLSKLKEGTAEYEAQTAAIEALKNELATLEPAYLRAYYNADLANEAVYAQTQAQLQAETAILAQMDKTDAGYKDQADKVAELTKKMEGLEVGHQRVIKAQKAATNAQNKYKSSLDKIKGQVNAMANYLGQVKSALSAVVDLIPLEEGSMAQAIMDGLLVGFDMAIAALTAIAAIIAVIEAELTPLLIIALSIGAAFGVIFAILKAIDAKHQKVIDSLQKKVDNLQESFEELEKAMEKAFGNRYIENYQAQLANLQEQAEAYEKMAEEESKKVKDKDEKKIKEYQKNAKEARKQIKEMHGQLAEFFSGTDLTSAARDFAGAWIDAYKSFANTTTAMREKFEELVQNMIVNSLAGAAMQNLLQPIFDQIDELASDGSLTAQDIAAISKNAEETIPQINDSMVNLMNQLAAAGINVRNSASGLTGISKDIASASEESILGLAAGINTQNYYISGIHNTVQLIYQTLSGGQAVNNARAQSNSAVDNASGTTDYFSYLPKIEANTAATAAECRNIVDELRKVIVPNSASSNYRVMTN